MQDAVIVERDTSPVPEESPVVETEEKKNMTFPEAIKDVIVGKRIQRLEWHDQEWVYLKGEDLVIHRNEQDHIWHIRTVDLTAEDYVSF